MLNQFGRFRPDVDPAMIESMARTMCSRDGRDPDETPFRAGSRDVLIALTGLNGEQKMWQLYIKLAEAALDGLWKAGYGMPPKITGDQP